jgi:adenylosuccinate lyase
LWAAGCAGLLAAYSKIASDLRLMAMSDEVFWPRVGTHVGSSAMPHKNNPVEAEQIRGFARMARGYAAMLEADPLWLERDISNSSVERVAVPDLWHTVLTATERLAQVLKSMELRPLMIEQRLMDHSNEAWSHRQVLASIADGDDYETAREMGREVQVESYDILEDARWFTRQYPKERA